MRLGNLAIKVEELDEVWHFFERAAGCRARARHELHGEEFAELELGGVAINAFRSALYETQGAPSLPAGWLHASFFCDDLDAILADTCWRDRLAWGPAEIEGGFGRRRVAFFEPIPGVRIEFMETR